MFKVILITASMALVTFGRPQTPPAAAPPAAGAAAAAAAAPAPAAAPTGNASAATYLKDERTPLDDKGSYKYDIELSDGTKLMQEGNTEAPAAGDNETFIVIKGSYSYTAPDGTPVNVMYIADKNGYQPVGDVIPKAAAQPAGAANASSAAAAPGAGPASAPTPNGASAPAPSAAAQPAAAPSSAASPPAAAAAQPPPPAAPAAGAPTQAQLF